MKKLKLKEMIKSLALPVLLLVGLVFTSATVSAQNYKSAEDAIILVQQEFATANELVGPSLTVRTLENGQSQAQVMVKVDFYKYLLTALNGSTTADALHVTEQRLSERYNTSETAPLLAQAKQEAIALLTL